MGQKEAKWRACSMVSGHLVAENGALGTKMSTFCSVVVFMHLRCYFSCLSIHAQVQAIYILGYSFL